MNKQHVKNYFRGYNNKFRDKVYKSKDDYAFYLTNLISVVKLYTYYDNDYIEGDESNIKKFVDMFDNDYDNYGYLDDKGHIYDFYKIPNMDFGCDIRKLEKIQLLVKQNEYPIVKKKKNTDQYVIKVIGDNGYGYLLPIRNY